MYEQYMIGMQLPLVEVWVYALTAACIGGIIYRLIKRQRHTENN